MSFEPPALSDADIRRAANEFLGKYHPTETLPIPIVKIAEVDIRLRVIPVPGLFLTDGYNSYLSIDRTTIVMDYQQYYEDRFAEKRRFSFGHEMGHYVPHKECHEDLPFHDRDSYTHWVHKRDRRMMKQFEAPAGTFAGLVLVPSPQLLKACRTIVRESESELRSGFEKGLDDIAAWSGLRMEVAETFCVSPATAEIRIKNDNIPALVPLPR